VDLAPLPFVVFADLVSQLGFGQALRSGLFLLLELEEVFLALRDQLPRGFGMGPQFFSDGLQPRLIVGAHAGTHVFGRRVRGRGDAREPRLVLATLFQ